MNKKTIITALLALVSLGASAQLESVKEVSMKSEYFNHERQVLIYTPVPVIRNQPFFHKLKFT